MACFRVTPRDIEHLLYLLEEMFNDVESGTVVANPLYYQEEDNGVKSCIGERGQLMVRQNALKIRSWADIFELESGVTTEGWTSLFVHYDDIHSIIRNTQLLYIMLHCSYWLPISDIPEIFHNMTTIAFT